MTIGERLRAAREARGVTQAQLAEALGTTRQQVYKYETGQQSMTADRLAEVCRVLSVSADYLLGLTGPAPRGRGGRLVFRGGVILSSRRGARTGTLCVSAETATPGLDVWTAPIGTAPVTRWAVPGGLARLRA